MYIYIYFVIIVFRNKFFFFIPNIYIYKSQSKSKYKLKQLQENCYHDDDAFLMLHVTMQKVMIKILKSKTDNVFPLRLIGIDVNIYIFNLNWILVIFFHSYNILCFLFYTFLIDIKMDKILFFL